MSGSLNKAILIGRLGRDPEVRVFQNGGKVCNLSVATEERWKDKDSGEQRSRTEWHRVAIFNEHLVDIAERYLKKGSLAYFEGQIETRKFTDQSGAERYSTEIVLRPYRGQLTLLGDGQERREPEPAGGGDLDDSIPFAKCIH